MSLASLVSRFALRITGFGFQDLGFGVWGLGFEVLGLGCGFRDLGFRVPVLGVRSKDSGFTLAKMALRVNYWLASCEIQGCVPGATCPFEKLYGAGAYTGTSLIRNSPPNYDHHMALGIVLL